MRSKPLKISVNDSNGKPTKRKEAVRATRWRRSWRDSTGRGKKARPHPSPYPPGEGEPSVALQVVMISRGAPKENRAKAKEQGLTFPVVLQRQWEISRIYAMFATPMAYLIGPDGAILSDPAVGAEPVVKLMAEARKPVQLEAAALA